MRMAFLCFFWLTLLPLSQAASGQNPGFAPAPAWVLPREVTSASVSTFDGPVTYLLVDRQESFVGPSPQSFFRLAGRVNNPAGLDELSQIQADFDPGFERLVFHKVQIIRGGDHWEVPLLAKNFELIRKEKDSDRQIFDGTLTASLLLHDLRVGDIVEYSYSIIGQQPLLGKKYSGRHELNWSVPVLEAHIRQIWPADTVMHWTLSKPSLTLQQRVEGPFLLAEWTGRKLPPILEEDLIPGWMEAFDAYYFSSWKDWAEVANWALPFYQVNAASDAAVEILAQSIRQKFPDSKARIEEAIRFVQDDIRYVGIEVGDGSFKPRQPQEVLQKRFGDCKDKSLLLSHLAQKLGYEAFPILVRSEGGQALDKNPPTPLAFNHVIVGLKSPEQPKLYWVDGTLQHQGLKLESRDYPNLYQGLPLQAGSSRLLKQDLTVTPQGRVEYTETFHSDDFASPVNLTIKSRYLGWQAEKMRTDLAMQGSVPLSDSLANFIKKMYPEAQITKEPVFEDDRSANIVTVEEAYEIPDLWQDEGEGAWRLDVVANAFIANSLAQPQKVKRTQPVSQMHDLQIVHRQDIKIPVEWVVPGDEKNVENTSFRYHFLQSYQNHILSFVHDWQSLRDHVSVQELPDYLHDAELVRYDIQRSINYRPKPAPSYWKGFSLALPQIIGLFILFLVAIGWHLQSDESSASGFVWPWRSLNFMLVLLVLSSGASALFWYADADRRLQKTDRTLLPRSWLWLSIAIFAAVLSSRVLQLLLDPESFDQVPLAMIAAVSALHLLWAIATLRWVRRDFPQLALRSWPAWIFGPLYFQGRLQNLKIPHYQEKPEAELGMELPENEQELRS